MLFYVFFHETIATILLQQQDHTNNANIRLKRHLFIADSPLFLTFKNKIYSVFQAICKQ